MASASGAIWRSCAGSSVMMMRVAGRKRSSCFRCGAEGLQITKSSTNAGMLANTKIVGLAEEQTFNVSLQIFVNTGQGGFGDANDVVGMIANAVWQATQKMPLAGTAPTVVPPGGGAPLGTGQPPGPGPGVFSDQQPTDFATWFENNALLIGLGIGALVLLAKVL